jgi:hypothetical protein
MTDMHASEYFKRRPAYTVALLGAMGCGKTLQAAYFPRIYYIGTDPTGLDTVVHSADPAIAALAANFVEVCPLNGVDVDTVFDPACDTEESIYGNIARAREMAIAGHIRTVVLDNLTYLVKMLESKIKIDQAKDTQAAWGELGRKTFELILAELLPFATRHACNVVIPIHVQRESETQVKGADALSSREKQQGVGGRMKRHVNLESDLSPSILGSTRDIIGGMPSAMIYMDAVPYEESGEQKLRYVALCQQQRYERWDTEVMAKNRYGLPASVDLTGASLYACLIQASKTAHGVRQKQEEARAAKAAAAAAKSSEPATGQQAPAAPDTMTNTNASKGE